MPTTRETFPVEFKGGLVTNISPLQQGINMPGSAITLKNFEPSIVGGYRRILGFSKFAAAKIPPYGLAVVDGKGQTGTSLTIARTHTTPVAGDTFTVAGITGTFTITGLSFDATNNRTTLTLGSSLGATAIVNGATSSTTALVLDNNSGTIEAGMEVTGTGISGTVTVASITDQNNIVLSSSQSLSNDVPLEFSPLNGAALTFKTYDTAYRTQGMEVFGDDVIVALNSDIYKTSGGDVAFTKVNVPAYGTVLVNGGSQTGGTLIVDGLTVAPQIGDMFTIAGVDKVYTVTSDASGTGGQTLNISPNLPSSPDNPADNAAVTFISLNREGAGRTRFSEYNFTGTRKVAIVDGANPPALYDGTTFTELTAAPSDAISATHVSNFKKHIFYGKADVVTFTAPSLDSDFTSGNGGGSFRVGGSVTGLIPFRETLVIFTDRTIQQISGSTLSDFTLKPISEDIGCIDGDTIQEIGGDIMFLTADGLRLLGATDRIGDFGLGIISKSIQSTLGDFIQSASLFTSLTVRAKSQYRLFAFNPDQVGAAAKGVIATQFSPQGGTDFAFAEIRGMEVFSASSKMVGSNEVIVFSGNDGFLYKMEDGNSFDGSNISAEYLSPYLPINDPRVRKTVYKANLFTDPQGAVNFTFNLKFDFDELNSVQPASISFSNESAQIAFFGVNTFAKYATTGSGSSGATTITVAANTNMEFGDTIAGTGIPTDTTITSINLADPTNIGTTTEATANVKAVTAKVNGATSSTTALVLDNNSGTIVVGMTVTGIGISGTVTVGNVTDQNNIILSSVQSLSDNVDLTFSSIFTTILGVDNNSGTIATGMSVSGTGVGSNVRVASITDQNNIVLSVPQDLSDNTALTFKNTTITISAALTSNISNVRVTNSASVFGGQVQNLFKTQTVGTGFTTAIQFRSDSTDPPFSLDTVTLEYGTNTRR